MFVLLYRSNSLSYA